MRTFYYHYGVISDKYLCDVLINESQEIKLSKASADFKTYILLMVSKRVLSICDF